MATADPLLTVSGKTTQATADYAPANVVAIWVQDAAGKFVKTIGRYAGMRKNHLVGWIAKAGINDVDAVTGATRTDHVMPIAATWDLKDKAGVLVPDGIYTIRMELADGNSTASGQNNQGVFTFTKGAVSQTQSALTNGGFTNVDIKFEPNANACNNGVMDPGETCDPPGSCPTACAASADACTPNELQGSAATCNAVCVTRTITACASGDGCCPAGCDPATDTDCVSQSGAGNDVGGGCDTGVGNGGLLALGLLGIAVLITRRKR